MRHVRSIKDDDLISTIVNLYYLQMVLVFILFFITVPFIGFWPAFALSTMNPITRYPLFKMGVVLGELMNRSQRDNVALSQLWQKSIILLFPYLPCGNNNSGVKYSQISNLSEVEKKGMSLTDKEYWKKSAVTTSVFLLVITLSVAIINIFASLLGAVWLQAIVPYAQSVVIIALTLDNGESTVAKFLRNKVFTFLGTIGMTIYCLVLLFIIITSFINSNYYYQYYTYSITSSFIISV